MNLPSPQQQHDEMSELVMYSLLTFVVWLIGCGAMGGLFYVAN